MKKMNGYKTKKASYFYEAFVLKKRQRLTLPGFTLVPSARVGLTALFEMGRGDPHRNSHPKIVILTLLVRTLISLTVLAKE